MALTQMQLIQSLGEAMSWLERELSWGVPPTELRHLCGRIGELYAAVITNGQMAQRVNQPGYDVVGSNGERISVKTTATSGHSYRRSFNLKTIDQVDRVIVLRINTEDMQVDTLFDGTINEVHAMMDDKGQLVIPAREERCEMRPLKKLQQVAHGRYVLTELENGRFEIEVDGSLVQPAKPHLMQLAQEIGIPYLQEDGRKFHTRILGNRVMKTLLMKQRS